MCVRRKGIAGKGSLPGDWENCQCSLGKSKENCWFSYQRKMPALAQKKSSSSLSSLSTDGTQLNETACKYVQIRIYTYISLYIERANTLYIQTLEPPSNCNVYAIFLCAFDAKHKLTLQTFCGLKSVASGTLSMGQSETGKERCRGVSEVWQV